MAAKIVKIEMTDAQILTLAASIATCCLVGPEQHLPAHKALARHVRDVEKSIMALAKLNGAELSEEMIQIGTGAWGAAMKYVAGRLAK